MTGIAEILSYAWAAAAGYTLLHSLWQGLIIASVVIVALRFIPSHLSNLRYGVASAGMLTMLLCAVATFVYLNARPANANLSQTHTSHYHFTLYHYDGVENTTIKEKVTLFIDHHMPILLTLWLAGALLFSIRLAGSLWYVNKLKREAILLDNLWSERLATLANRWEITRVVRLAESASVQAPVVIGYFKPLILIPIGMLSGLTTDQIEAIFLHELSHIKRHDYLINLFQSLAEALFFFNPFVWMISGIMRREREHCCDDAVINETKNAKAYVVALGRLEEKRILQPGLAMSFASGKNELLNRIKRIMETSVKHHSGRERIIPALLIVVGLISASWITMKASEKTAAPSWQEDNTLLQDTTKKKKSEKSATYKRKKVITIGPDGKPHEEIEENFEGDESLRGLMISPDFDFDLNFDPDHLGAIPPLPNLENLIPQFPHFDHPFNFDFDSLRGRTWSFRSDDWEKFSEQFDKHFKEHFGDFHNRHQGELKKMMEDLRNNMRHNFGDDWKNHRDDKLNEELNKNEDKFRRLEDRMQHFHEGKLNKLEENLRSMEEKLKAFNAEVRDELIQDGYLKPSEKIKMLSIGENGEMEVNGKKIGKADQGKYNKLHEKYFDGKGSFRYVE